MKVALSKETPMRRLSLMSMAVAVALATSLGVLSGSGAPSAAASPVPDAVRAVMAGGNTLGDQVREATPRSDGYRHIDSAALVASIAAANANTIVYPLWISPTDWGDLVNGFAAAAETAGIDVWVYVVPPTECVNPPTGRCSYPYTTDYVQWAQKIAELSLAHPNVSAWAIDDFNAGGNHETVFTPAYMAQIQAASANVNPDLKFYPTSYFSSASETSAFLTTYGQYIDGILVPFRTTADNSYSVSHINTVLGQLATLGATHDKEIIMMPYVGREFTTTVDPRPEDVAKQFELVQPFLEDGSIRGVIGYGTPLAGTPAPPSQNQAFEGTGHLRIFGMGYPEAGQTPTATQTVAVTPGLSSYSLSLRTFDQFGGATSAPWIGHMKKQVLVDGVVAWEADVASGTPYTWEPVTIDVTSQVAGKSQVSLQLRTVGYGTIGLLGVDVGFDQVTANGLSVVNGDFENSSGWTVSTNSGVMTARIAHWSANDPARVLATVARNFADLAGTSGPSVPAPERIEPINGNTMSGRGSLEFSLSAGDSMAAGQCATAAQTVAVQPGFDRYEFGLYRADFLTGAAANKFTHYVQFGNSATPAFQADAFTTHNGTWMNGADLIGPADVTQWVAGQSMVTITIKMCANTAISGTHVRVGFDQLSSVGLTVVNPGFEQPGGWTLTNGGGLKVAIRTSSPRPATLIDASDRISLFRTEGDGWLRRMAQTSAGSSFASAVRVSDTTGVVGTPAVVEVGGVEGVYARSAYGQVWGASRGSGASGFTAWVPVGSGQPTFVGDPVAIVSSGIVAVYAKASDGKIWGSSQSGPGAAFGAWAPVGASGGGVTGQPQVIVVGGVIAIYSRTDGGTIAGVSQTAPGGSFGTWTQLGTGQPGFASDPVATVGPSGAVSLYAVGVDGKMWGSSQSAPGSSFGPWMLIGTAGGGVTGSPAAHFINGKISIYSRTTTNTIAMVAQGTAGGSFGTWEAVGSSQPVIIGDPVVVRTSTGTTAVYAAAEDGRIWGATRTPTATSFGAWAPIG